MAAALSLHSLTRHFGALKAVEQVSMQIEEGERRAVIGPNGAGKTTLFHVVSGMLPPTSGRIDVFGTDVTVLPTHKRIALGMARTFQITNLFRRLTVERNVILALQALTRTKLSMFRTLSANKPLLRAAEQQMEEWNLLDRRHALV